MVAAALAVVVANIVSPAGEAPPVLSLLADLPEKRESGKAFLERTAWEKASGDMARIYVEDRSLVLTCDGDRVMIGQGEEPFPFDLRTRQFVQFSIKIEELPPAADLSKSATDDSCFRLMLAFGKQSIFSTPPIVAYTWAAREEPGTIMTSEYSDNLKYIIIGKGKPAEAKYFRFVRDVAADYRRAFGGAEPPKLYGVILKLDTNQLGGKARSRINFLALAPKAEWLGPAESIAPPGPPKPPASPAKPAVEQAR